MTNRMVELSQHVMAPREEQLVREALRSGRVEGDGPFTRTAAGILEEMFGAPRVLLTPSCTHALELCALLLNIGPENEVVMPSFTFVSTANAFALRGARIRFADIDPTTWSMGASEIASAITPRTSHVVAVHYAGVAADPVAVVELCRNRGIELIEDNAHGLFGKWGGYPLGTFGRASALSFHRTKNISCGEGGALVLNESSLIGRAEVLREKGTDRSQFIRGEVDKYTWRDIGSSYLMSDILAAVLVAQLENSLESQRRRQQTWQVYDRILSKQAGDLGIKLQSISSAVTNPYHTFAFLSPRNSERKAIIASLAERNIRASAHYEPLHLAPRHHREERLPVTEEVSSRIIRLPLHAAITVDEAVRVANCVLTVLRGWT